MRFRWNQPEVQLDVVMSSALNSGTLVLRLPTSPRVTFVVHCER